MIGHYFLDIVALGWQRRPVQTGKWVFCVGEIPTLNVCRYPKCQLYPRMSASEP
jgi:hypothetical protein